MGEMRFANVDPWSVLLGPDHGGVMRLICSSIVKMPFDDALRQLEQFDAAGPIVDPTSYREVMENVPKLRRIVKAAKDLQDALRAVLEEAQPEPAEVP